ncbi:MAG: tRNA dimethylallyltransferase [Paracoccaceae bacterium]|nr:MAG: tRNA (adenosine(37)-N6)-dimethylallyltransferase MiaA [Alphaproteobacteria bacterium]GIX14138.1 MAG: tRNA dimethylallyltransferase [Paracoccaceae bacterium]
MRPPVLIAGPTASGKSALALAIARALGAVVVNADALQVYAGWRVLTARPGPGDEAAAPHALYGHVGMEEPWSVGHWLRAVRPLLAGPRPVVIVGGTGLYFMALTEGLAEIPPIPPAIRARAEAIRARGGAAALARALARRDPATLARIDRANPVRLQRAWEVLEATGRGLAEWQARTPPPLVTAAHRLLIWPGRDWLADRIARRFDRMLEEGALEEVRANMARDWRLPSMQALGAAELAAHLRGDTTLEAARSAALAATRQYAKRQRTWFRRRMGDWTRIDPADRAALAAVVEDLSAAR